MPELFRQLTPYLPELFGTVPANNTLFAKTVLANNLFDIKGLKDIVEIVENRGEGRNERESRDIGECVVKRGK